MKSFKKNTHFPGLIIFLGFLSCGWQTSFCTTVTWDVTEIFGVDTIDASPGTIHALDSARIFFSSHPNDTMVLNYPAGEFNFLANAPTIDFGSSFSPGVEGRLVIQGAGYESTVFITKDRREHSIYGRNVYRVLFKGIHFTRDYCTVSQGTVVSIAAGEVVLDLHDGFPTPDSLMAIGRQNSAGLWLRKYTDDIEDPHIITENNDQIAWDTANTYQVENRVWRIGLKNSSIVAPYNQGDIIGIKLKHGGQTYWFCGGDDIHFESCKWTRKTRGVLRCEISNVSFIDCHFDRGPKVGGRTPVMASPGGGPQIGQPYDNEIYNVVVENCTFISSGDDNVALFHVNGGVIRNIVSKDAFARGILLNQSKNICLENNVVERSPILWTGGGDGASICDTPVTNLDKEPPSMVTGLSVADTGYNSVTIIWDPATDNIGVEGYEIYLANNFILSTSDTIAIISELNPGIFYSFRVLAVDSSGNKSQISAVSVTTREDALSNIIPGDFELNSNLLMFPNPAHDILHISLFQEPTNASFKLTDLSGRLQLHYRISASGSEVDISRLKKGIYIAELCVEDKIHRKRLILQ